MSYLHVVDRDVNQFDEKSDECHDNEANGGCDGDFLKFFLVGLSTPLYKVNGLTN